MEFSQLFASYNLVSPDKNENITVIPEETIDYNPIAKTYMLNTPRVELIKLLPTKPTIQLEPRSPKLIITRLTYKLPTEVKLELKGSDSFEQAFAKAAQINPSVTKYKNFLTRTAKRESGFNSYILSKSGAPYYGYFQMGMPAIKSTSNLSLEQFRRDPVLLILSACKLYDLFISEAKRLNIYDLCKSKGYSDDAIAAGAWAGGIGGVKKFVTGKGNPSDAHWWGGKGGTSVGKLMEEFK